MMSSLTTCSGQGVVVQGKERKKSVYPRISGIDPHSKQSLRLSLRGDQPFEDQGDGGEREG